MVVGAVVDVLSAVGGQRSIQVDGGSPGGEVEPVDNSLLVGCGGPVGETVLPDFRGGGDETEVHRHGHVADQCVQIAHILVQLGRLGVLYPIDKGVLLPEVDPVILLLTGQPLTPGLHGHPEVPAHDVVGDILLRVCHKLPAAQALG